MNSLFEYKSTRIFCIYGELTDLFCLPDTRVVNFEELLTIKLTALGYENVVFCSTQGGRFFSLEPKKVLEILGSTEDKKEKETSDAVNAMRHISRFQASNASPDTTSDKEIQTKKKAADVEEENYVRKIDIEQIPFTANRYMCSNEKQKALVFTSIEDLLKICEGNEVQREVGRELMGYFEDWKSLPIDNRNICIILSKIQGGFDIHKMLKEESRNAVLTSLFLTNGVFNINSCINVGDPLDDEIRNILEHLRINGITYLADNNFITSKLIFSHTSENINTLTRMLSFYNRENGYHQLKNILEVLEYFMVRSGTTEVWITPDDIPGLFPRENACYCADEDPLEKLRTTEGWEPAYHIMNSFVKNHNALYGSKNYNAEKEYQLIVDRFEPGISTHGRPRGKIPNFVLQGPPGVGKTEIAKLIGRLLQKEGVLKSGHTIIGTRDKMVSEYVGETSIKTANIIAQAQEGVLLVDEVYSLAEKNENGNRSYCNEVFDTIVAAMTNPNYHFCVVFAGYKSRMHEVWSMNEGLYSRFSSTNIITLKEYQPELLQKIFVDSFNKPEGNGNLIIKLSDDVKSVLPIFFKNFFDDRDRKEFGNARDVNNLVNDVKRCATYRYLTDIENNRIDSIENKNTVIVERVDFESRAGLFEKRGKSTSEIFKCLDDYVGFEFLAKMFNDQLAVKVECQEKGIPYPGPSHMIWAGNPGTGKSTAAQLTAELYHNLGMLGGTEPIYVDASEIMSKFVSGGAEKMNQKIDEACKNNAVLVIEEAYQLSDGHGQIDAINAMLNRMEIDRKNFNLILILYKDKVEEFLNKNPGLRSRLMIYEFEDYDAEALFNIFEKMCKKGHDTMSMDCRKTIREYLSAMYSEGRTKNGNARIVRQIYELMKQKRFERVNKSLAQKYEKDVNDIVSARATGSLKEMGIKMPSDIFEFQREDVPSIEFDSYSHK